MAIGNHDVSLLNPHIDRNPRIAHFRLRSIRQMVRKAHDGTGAIRRAGILPHKLPKWFEISNENEAAQRLEAMMAKDLQYDPVVKW